MRRCNVTILDYFLQSARRAVAPLYRSRVMSPFKSWWETHRGLPMVRRRHRRFLTDPPSIEAGIQSITRDADPQHSVDRPVFLFAAGWRSGSTLLQRLIMSGRDIFLWGEPYSRCNLVARLSESLRPLASDDWPWRRRQIQLPLRVDPEHDWIANLYPPADRLLAAHRAFFRQAFAEPAEEMGFARWGFKEVRLDSSHAQYLRTLFPRAQFIFLYRNPYHAWRSYRAMGRSWYRNWPEEPVFTPRQFGEMWVELTGDLLGASDRFDAMVVRFEELQRVHTLQEISSFLSTSISADVLDEVIGSSRDRGRYRIHREEQKVLKGIVNPLADELGYSGP